MTAPSVLLVDDGELDAIQVLLGRLRVDWVRCLEADAEAELERPRDVLICSGPRATSMPPFSGASEPIWICLYDRDFLPLREALAAQGVHYLVSSDLGSRALELFLRQLLHQGDERRRVRRIPVDCEVQLEVGAERKQAQLLELSPGGCLFSCDAGIPPERRVVVRLPAQTLTGDEVLEIPGHVVRATVVPEEDGGLVHVIRFGDLDAETRAGIQHVLRGETLDSEVTPLRDEPERRRGDAAESVPLVGDASLELADAEPDPPRPPRRERRSAARRPYTRCVDAIRWEGEESPEIVFARDLSLGGVRIATSSQPRLGSVVTLALYGGSREEPVMVQARVVRVDGEDAGMRFEPLDPARRRDLTRLIEGAPRVERLVGRASALCVAELLGD